MSLLNKLLPPPLTNPFFRSPGEALDAVIRPIQQQTGIPGSYQFIEQGIQKLLQPGKQAKQKPPMPGLPADYKQTELAAGAAAEAFRPGAGFPGQQAAAERAYEAEKSRVAQLTAQDPELQRYEAARKVATATNATPEKVQSAEDIGMQIWQQKYGNTPMGQSGGAVGRYNPLMERTFGYQSGSAPGQQIGAPTLGPSPLVPQVDQSLNPASPSFIGGEGGPLMNFADENLTPEMIESYQKQLLSQAASRK
jgi:hypothetical protein